MATFTAGPTGADFDGLNLASLALGFVQSQTPGSFDILIGPEQVHFFGAAFAFAGDGFPYGGTITHIRDDISGSNVFDLSDFALPASTLMGWATAGANELAKATVLGGADIIEGSNASDLMRGFGGADTVHGYSGDDYLEGGFGDDRVFGDDGADTVVDSSGSNYLRGGAGNDWVIGGADFDDAHGNIGDDTVSGGGFDDWVVGGQGNDTLFGDDGGDLVYGQLGSDTCSGGAGNDGIAGGQASDSLSGGAGDDYISGDRGDDTISGGSGADTFHSFAAADLDRIVDFNAGEGDRLLLDAGSVYVMAQVGGDTIVTIGGAAQVVLVGVSLANLPSSAIVVG